jgi:uncharacterized protein (TIGR03435 family)
MLEEVNIGSPQEGGLAVPKLGDAFGTRRRRLFSAGILAIFVGMLSTLQSQIQSQAQSPASTFEFEVASIKASNPAAPDGFMTIPGPGSINDSFSAKNVTLMALIRAAYGIPLGSEDSRISGGPNWLKSEKYDVDAKIDSSVLEELKKLSPDQRAFAQQHMLQMLLADRFKLGTHHETKDLPIYTLILAKSGLKLQEAKPDEATSTSSYTGPGGTQFILGQARPISSLVRMLSVSLSCPILDKTGLPGKYDFKLKWTPDNSQSQTLSSGALSDRPTPEQDSGASSIFTAIQEQLGLKLVSGKGPVEIVLIDHVERPSAN